MKTKDKENQEQQVEETHDSLSRNILGKLGTLNDSEIPVDGEKKEEKKEEKADDKEEVVVRETISDDKKEEKKEEKSEEKKEEKADDKADDKKEKKEEKADDKTDDEFTGEIVISCSDDEAPAVGDEVSLDGEAVEDGEYAFGDEDTPMYVKDGKIEAVGEEQVSDLMKKIVKGGEVVKKKVRAKKMRMSSKQKAALKKAQKKSGTAAAKKARAKSMKIRRTKIAASEEHAGAEEKQVDGIDLKVLGDSLLLAGMNHLKDELNLGDEQIDFLDENLPEEAFTAEIADNVIKVQIPIWTEINDEVELADFELQTFELELEGEFDNESLAEQLTDGEDNILGQLII